MRKLARWIKEVINMEENLNKEIEALYKKNK